VSVTLQKEAKDETLKVEIIKAGTVLAESTTTAEYGLVTAATR